jgi:hypothetical protein
MCKILQGSKSVNSETGTANLTQGSVWIDCSTKNWAHLTTICEPIVYKMWAPRRLTTLRASTACQRNSSRSVIGDEYIEVFCVSLQPKIQRTEVRRLCRPVDWAYAPYALKMRRCPVMHEPYVLLMKRRM